MDWYKDLNKKNRLSIFSFLNVLISRSELGINEENLIIIFDEQELNNLEVSLTELKDIIKFIENKAFLKIRSLNSEIIKRAREDCSKQANDIFDFNKGNFDLYENCLLNSIESTTGEAYGDKSIIDKIEIVEIPRKSLVKTKELIKSLVAINKKKFLTSNDDVVSSFQLLSLTKDGLLFEDKEFRSEITLPDGEKRFNFLCCLMDVQSSGSKFMFIPTSEIIAKIGKSDFKSLFSKINSQVLKNTSYRIKTSKGNGFKIEKV